MIITLPVNIIYRLCITVVFAALLLSLGDKASAQTLGRYIPMNASGGGDIVLSDSSKSLHKVYTFRLQGRPEITSENIEVRSIELALNSDTIPESKWEDILLERSGSIEQIGPYDSVDIRNRTDANERDLLGYSDMSIDGNVITITPDQPIFISAGDSYVPFDIIFAFADSQSLEGVGDARFTVQIADQDIKVVGGEVDGTDDVTIQAKSFYESDEINLLTLEDLDAAEESYLEVEFDKRSSNAILVEEQAGSARAEIMGFMITPRNLEAGQTIETLKIDLPLSFGSAAIDEGNTNAAMYMEDVYTLVNDQQPETDVNFEGGAYAELGNLELEEDESYKIIVQLIFKDAVELAQLPVQLSRAKVRSAYGEDIDRGVVGGRYEDLFILQIDSPGSAAEYDLPGSGPVTDEGSAGGPASADEQSEAGTYVVTSDDLNVRVSPGGEVRGQVPVGTRGQITDGPTFLSDYRWYEVRYDNQLSGWSASEWLTKIPTQPASPIMLQPSCSLSASPNAVPANGGEVTFTWDAQFSDTVSLNGVDYSDLGRDQYGNSNRFPARGGTYTMEVQPGTQTLAVRNENGVSECTVEVGDRLSSTVPAEQTTGSTRAQMLQRIQTLRSIVERLQTQMTPVRNQSPAADNTASEGAPTTANNQNANAAREATVRLYRDGQQVLTVEGRTRGRAVQMCDWYSERRPGSDWRCTWNEQVIGQHAAQPGISESEPERQTGIIELEESTASVEILRDGDPITLPTPELSEDQTEDLCRWYYREISDAKWECYWGSERVAEYGETQIDESEKESEGDLLIYRDDELYRQFEARPREWSEEQCEYYPEEYPDSDWRCVWNDEVVGEFDATPGGTDGNDEPVGTYELYLDDSNQPNIRTEDITEAAAIDNCELNAQGNEDAEVVCYWDGEVIYERAAILSEDNVSSTPGETLRPGIVHVQPCGSSYRDPYNQIDVANVPNNAVVVLLNCLPRDWQVFNEEDSNLYGVITYTVDGEGVSDIVGVDNSTFTSTYDATTPGLNSDEMFDLYVGGDQDDMAEIMRNNFDAELIGYTRETYPFVRVTGNGETELMGKILP